MDRIDEEIGQQEMPLLQPMKDALGRASRMCRAKPSMKSYWLR